MDENVNGTETTLEEIVEEMGTRSAGPEGAGGFRFPPEPPLDSPSPLEPTRAEALDPGLRAEDGEKANPEEAPAQEGSGDAVDKKARFEQDLKSLLDDGWTMDELAAFAQDEQVRAAVDGGTGIRKAAKAYLQRGGGASPKKRAVPTMRSAGAGETDAGDPIARMSDKEFDAFYARAMEKAMTGARVRI